MKAFCKNHEKIDWKFHEYFSKYVCLPNIISSCVISWKFQQKSRKIPRTSQKFSRNFQYIFSFSKTPFASFRKLHLLQSFSPQSFLNTSHFQPFSTNIKKFPFCPITFFSSLFKSAGSKAWRMFQFSQTWNSSDIQYNAEAFQPFPGINIKSQILKFTFTHFNLGQNSKCKCVKGKHRNNPFWAARKSFLAFDYIISDFSFFFYINASRSYRSDIHWTQTYLSKKPTTSCHFYFVRGKRRRK